MMKKFDITELSPYAKFTIANKGYYFWDKKKQIIVYKWEIFNTFNAKELKNIYNGTQNRYIRRRHNSNNFKIL